MLSALLVGSLGALLGLVGSGDEPRTPRQALHPFNELIGSWRASGEMVPASRGRPWKETHAWTWRFRDNDAWLEGTITDGQRFRGAELRWRAGSDLFELKMLPADANADPVVFVGLLSENGRSLVVEREDEGSKETQRLTLNFVGEIRYVLRLERRPAGRTQFVRDFQVAAQREGESLAGKPANQKPVCIVSGGLGTMTVSHQDRTFYVCCTGCRDEFNANPEKYIKEWEESQKKRP
ncbi:MAG TPA: hypothetical protein PKC45_04185 [Gemmatales bacterium]|nr:hypothetical protein [Gemmatales bacterium]